MSKDKSTYFAITCVTMFAVQGALAANTNPTPKQVVADYTRPLSFEPNRGQADKRVDFLAHGTGYGLFLSHVGAVMTFEHGAAIRMRPVGANTFSQPEPLDPQASKSNYFIGNVPQKWHTSVPNYTKVRYRNVYRGIDLVYYGNQRQLEYDFVVSPGARPERILLDFQGETKAALDRSGDLLMRTAAGDLSWHKPVAYQEVEGVRKLVACAYVRKGGQLGFKLAAYDRTKPLIIDPVLEYSTYLGGSGGDLAYGIAADSRGNAYVTGATQSADFPIKNAFQSFASGASFTPNVFITKFNAAGELVYSTYLGGSGFCISECQFHQGDIGMAIVIDRYGNAYVTGSTVSYDFPVKNAFQSSLGGEYPVFNAFVTKLDATGSALVYSTYLGGSGGDCGGTTCGDQGNAIALDSADNVYVAGFTQSADFPTQNAFQNSIEGTGKMNAFVTKLDAAGTSLVYSTFLGESNSPCCDQAFGVAVDRYGEAFVTGTTSSSNFPTKNAFQNVLKPGPSAFVTKFDAAGTALVYSTYLGPATGKAIAVDKHGNAYVTGATTSADFPVKHAFQDHNNCPGCSNAFVTKFDAAGSSLIYSTYLGGSVGVSALFFPGDAGNSVAVDRQGRAYITGTATSTDFPMKDAFQTLNREQVFGTAFVAELDATGDALVYSSYLGGSGGAQDGDQGNGIAVDKNGNAYVTGGTSSTDFPVQKAFQGTFNGFEDAFVTKISAK
jgi:hypothetical protein